MPPAYRKPETRCWCNACELVSINTCVHPSSTICFKSLFRLTASGVVCVAAITLSAIKFSTVLINPQVYPKLVKSLYNNVAIVVFPLVPVTPVSFNFSDGLSKKLCAICPAADALLATSTYTTCSFSKAGSCSHTTTAAPFATACSINK